MSFILEVLQGHSDTSDVHSPVSSSKVPKIPLYNWSPQTPPFPSFLKRFYEPCLHISGGVRGGEVLHAYSDQLLRRDWPQEELAVEGLPTGLAEVFREEGVNDGVDAGVPVGQAMGDDTEGEGDVVQGKVPELCPHCDDVVRQPGQQEHSNHEKHCLRCLERQDQVLNCCCAHVSQVRQHDLQW